MPVGTRVYVPQDYLQDYKCESGWHYHKNSLNNFENCYLIANISSPFSTAQRNCENNGAALVSILNSEENDFVAHLLYKKSFQALSGIGLRIIAHAKSTPGCKREEETVSRFA